MAKEAKFAMEQLDSEMMMFFTLKVMFKLGYINEPTYKNVISHKFSKFADMAY